jgi:hypothetical protein
LAKNWLLSIGKSVRSATETLIEVDGVMGEGGGQVLRSVLSLSLLTGHARFISHTFVTIETAPVCDPSI